MLFVPRRVVSRLADLTPEEAVDLWLLAQRVGPRLEAHFGASALTYAVQDGAAAGQTVPHVHIHLLPRRAGDFARNDEVYDRVRRAACASARLSAETCAQIDDSEREAAQQRLSKDLDKERVARSPAEMAAEAAILRAVCAGLS